MFLLLKGGCNWKSFLLIWNMNNVIGGCTLALQIKEITKKFGDFTAVNNLNFTIPEKEMFGF